MKQGWKLLTTGIEVFRISWRERNRQYHKEVIKPRSLLEVSCFCLLGLMRFEEMHTCVQLGSLLTPTHKSFTVR